ncbi:hypothetical protein VHEMI02461 [[Torrubiella] hemipterigena]|uniref:Amidase domain-containing protein n=1 Tax=[Torrubiella] hemipterigena TaxID=1531966 RepID=A0A0A1T890_9HYPO|nr:hypothetical protein VHEMI02461 [[Torrubiella] hemipterigena]
MTGYTFLDWSADETIYAIRHRHITARKYITSVLSQANKVAPLNSIINLLADDALTAADAIDQKIAHGLPLGPLAGLAIVAKDNINLAGHLTTAGTPALNCSRPDTTAPSLRKLIAAGAIVIGKANMHELALGITSTNFSPFAGAVHNPYNDSMIPGGSSGGTAAAVASRIVTCGLGTDTGGSTRIPAALTGTVGFRPSVGNGGRERRYHDEGAVVPISHTRDTVGTLGRCMADVTLLDSIITGGPRANPIDVSGVRFGLPPSLWNDLDNQLQAVVTAAKASLQAAGAVLVDADLPDLLALDDKISLPLALHEPIADIPAYLKANGYTNITLADIAAKVASPDVAKLFEAISSDAFGSQYNDAINIHRPALQHMYQQYFTSNNLSAVLFPTTVLPARPIDLIHGSGNVSINGGPPVDAFATYIRLTSPGSDAGIPGLSIPAGLTSDRLPVGIEIDGPLGSDMTLLGLGLTIEKKFGRLPPPPGC